LNAEEAGAIAVIVCNIFNDDLINMGPGEVGDMVSIYSCMIRNSDCEQIKLAMENNDLEVSLEYIAEECFLDDELPIVWGLNGEGSFDDGMGDWEVSTENNEDQVFIHTEISTNSGALVQGIYSIESPTGCNGAVIADFDFFSTQGNIETASNLQQPYPQYSGSLISPSIDLSNVESPSVVFHQFNLPLNGINTFEYSIDDGETWLEEQIIETQNVFNSNEASDTLITEEIKINITEAAGQSQVKLRFNYNNNDFYFWLLDDIIITGNMVSNTEDLVSQNKMTLSPNPAIDLINIQLERPMNGLAKIEVLSTNGQLIYSEVIKNSTQQLQLNLQNHKGGIYIVSITSEKEELTQKIILE